MGSKGTIVLVHGIFDTSRVFVPLMGRLEKAGYRCLAPSLKPSDGSAGIAALAAELRLYVDNNLGEEARFALIAFSMGCLVSRYYLQEMGGAGRADAFLAISGPHGGSLWAFLWPGAGSRDMRPGSVFLRSLKRTETRLGRMPVYSYWTPLDLMILPAWSSVWERARNRRILVGCHPCMLSSRRVHERLLVDLRKREDGVEIDG